MCPRTQSHTLRCNFVSVPFCALCVCVTLLPSSRKSMLFFAVQNVIYFSIQTNKTEMYIHLCEATVRADCVGCPEKLFSKVRCANVKRMTFVSSFFWVSHQLLLALTRCSQYFELQLERNSRSIAINGDTKWKWKTNEAEKNGQENHSSKRLKP